MKKTLASAVITVVLGSAALGQGTVNFCNYFTGTISDPRVYYTDGVSWPGPQFRVSLYGGATIASMVSLATTTFLSQGYFFGGVVAVPGVSGGARGFFQVAAWDSTLNGTTTDATFADAEVYSTTHSGPPVWGISAIFQNPTGNPDATPPGLPADLLNMQSFSFGPIPEPSSTVLGLLAAAMWLGRARARRKR